jgi:hypothetical protein
MSHQFPEPPVVAGYVKRLADWGTRPVRLIGKTTKFKLKKYHRIAVSRVGGLDFVHEPEDQAIARISRENAEALKAAE